jgi:hypothetical protein
MREQDAKNLISYGEMRFGFMSEFTSMAPAEK